MRLGDRIKHGEVTVPENSLYDPETDSIRSMTILELSLENKVALEDIQKYIIEELNKSLEEKFSDGFEFNGIEYSAGLETRTLITGLIGAVLFLGNMVTFPQYFPNKYDRTATINTLEEFKQLSATFLYFTATVSEEHGRIKEIVRRAKTASEAATAFISWEKNNG